MRHPLWIVNSSLLFLLLTNVIFVFFSRQELPQPRKITKKKTELVPAKKIESISLSKIYENDIFDTIKHPVVKIEDNIKLQQAPTPPTGSTPSVPVEAAIQTLPPLNVTLRGVMIISDNSNNIAIIADNATLKEKNYKIGDILQDAQIIKILANRVVLIRSNGQQEMLYLSDKDAANALLANKAKDNWSNIVVKEKEGFYKVDPSHFVEFIASLSLLLDMFDVVTVYKQGKSIGCRIGSLDKSDLGTALGFMSYDLITKIAEKPVSTLDERLYVYQHVITLKRGESFAVELQRKGSPVIITFTLTDLENSLVKQLDIETAKVTEKTGILEGPSAEELEEQRMVMLKEKYQFAPTMQEILLQQKKAMLHEGRENRLHDFSFPNETHI